MSCRIVMIGGGSYNWTAGLAKDLFLREGLAGSELVLVDIKPEAARLLEAYCTKLAERIGTGWRVRVADLEAALDGADYVCASISTGDLAAMGLDYHIPEEYGVFHTVGDTVGPGGISRTLRNVPVFVDFAAKMERICPQAWMIHVTNPLSQLTRAMDRTSSIRSVGLCHNYAGTISFLADYLGASEEDIDAISVGVNHYTWLKEITCRGERVEGQLSLRRYLEHEAGREGELKTNTLDDQINATTAGDKTLEYYINFELLERFGHFPVGASPHVAENFPYYCNSLETLGRHHIRRKGVLPGREKGREGNRRKIQDIVEGRAELPEEFHPSREGLSVVVQALHTGRSARVIVAMGNRGQVSNLPEGAIVETWAEISGSGVFPIASGPIPDPLLGMMQMIIDEQELAVEAALTGDRKKAVAAMVVSPMVANKDCAEELTDKLLAAHKQWLPQFFGK